MAISILAAFCVSVSAAPSNFVESPSAGKPVQLQSFEVDSEDCTMDLVLTNYSERNTLSAAAREKLEGAYGAIVNATDLTALNTDLKNLASKNKIPAEKLAVSDLFDLSYVGCADHDDHGYVTVKFKAETLKNFVGLLHKNGDKWELISDAKASGDTLTFKVDDFSPFAIVVNTDPNGSGTPETGDSFPWLYVVMLVVSGTGLAVLGITSFRTRKEH